ncbi:MAG: ATP-dependent DNA ligase [Ilumatobacter sp.]
MTDELWDLPIQPPVEPMLAKLARAIPDSVAGADGGGWLFEPKWDGFRCLVFRTGDRIELFSRKLKPLARYFPELLGPLRHALPDRCIVDGEIVVPDAGAHGLDFDALLQRIHPAESRINRLAAETPSVFVAFDLLAVGDRVWTDSKMVERRVELERIVVENETVRVTPASTDRVRAEAWFSVFEGAGLDGVIAKPVDGVYQPGKRALVKVKHQRRGIVAIPGFRIHKDGKGVGSLMCALFGADGHLQSVGVAASFSVKRRAELLEELRPHAIDVAGGQSFASHPWADWISWQEERRAKVAAGESTSAADRAAGGSRWSLGKDTSFVPLATTSDAGLVAEVGFGQLESGRFRHGVSFVAWRDDLAPRDCQIDQLDVALPVEFASLFD